MSNEIRIQAEVLSDEVCQFTVDRPIYPGKSWHFARKDEAKGSPLVEKLFNIENVAAILVVDNVLKVTKIGLDDWMQTAKQIGVTIRAQLQSGVPAISNDLGANLPSEDKIRDKIQHLFDEEINPAVGQHGGYVELVDVKQNRVFLQLGGGCQGCGMVDVTLKQGIEKAIREVVPQIGEILDVTDHADGRNPYYSASKK